jgi:6-phosphogluconolactonase
VFHRRVTTSMNLCIILAVRFALSLVPMAVSAADAPQPSQGREFFVYLGTYNGPKSKGIYRSRFDVTTGKLTAPELAAEAENPTFLAVHPSLPALYSAERPVLYAANEIKAGTVSAYAVNRSDGKLTLLNQRSARGNGPCHLSVDKLGRHMLVANYGSGSIAALPIDADGRLGEATGFVQHQGSSVNKQRQEGPHAHWIDTDPGNRFALVCDLGLDQVRSYKLDTAQGTLTQNDTPFASVQVGSGPRHLAFHPNGVFAYVINELSNTVTAFAFHPQRGALKEFQTVSTLPRDFTGGSSTAEIEVHPSGRFLYGSNRGHDSIALFAIDSVTGKLTLIEHQSTQGKTPRNFAIDPTGRWLLAANQDSDNVVLFSVEPETGRLNPTGQTIEVGKPVYVRFVPVR